MSNEPVPRVAECRIPYTPRPAFLPFHRRAENEAVVICHRRAGKSIAICNDGQWRCCANERRDPPPRYAWFYPTRVRAKDAVWERLKHYAAPIPGHRVIESELAIEYPNVGRFTLYGAENSRAVGLWLDGVYYDECDEMPPKTIEEVAPTLADYNGFVVYAGYLRGRHNLFKRHQAAVGRPGIFTMYLRASESGIYPPEVLARQRAMMSEAAYQMQWELDVNASIANAIYGKQMDDLRREGRLKLVLADTQAPLYTFWDIGHSDRGDDWAVWLVQLVQRDILLLESFSRTGETPAYYAAKVREWEDKYHLRVALNYLPHDAKQRNQVGKTTQEYLKDAGLDRTRTVARTMDIWRSIDQMRALFPRVYLNSAGCSDTWTLGDMEMPSGIDALDYYSKKEEASTGLITDVPVHDQYSHLADALRTFAEAYSQGMLEGHSEIATHPGGPTRVKVSRERKQYYGDGFNRIRVNR
jgi:hypothetical protein